VRENLRSCLVRDDVMKELVFTGHVLPASEGAAKFAADFEKRKARELEERLNRRSDPSPSKVRKLPR